MSNETRIEIFGTDGSYWPVYGRGSSGCGVALGEDQVRGLFEAPVRTSWVSSTLQTGGSMKGRWYDVRDISLGFHILESATQPWERVYSKFRQAFDFREDDWDHDAQLARIDVTTAMSGTRSLYVQLHETLDFNPARDPVKRKHGNPIIPLRAGQPFWFQPDVVTAVTLGPGPATGTIPVENPTNLPMYQKWILTPAEWTLPDISWQGPRGKRVPGVDKRSGRDDRNRMVMLPPVTAQHGGAVVDLDPMELMIRDVADTNMLGQMPIPGQFFMYEVPPYTPRTELPIQVSATPEGGAMARLVQPRLWREPMGGELW